MSLALLSAPASANEYSVAAGYYQSGQWQAAVAAWDAYLEQQTAGPRRAEAEFFRCESLVQLDEHAAAIEGFAEFLKQHPGHALSARARFRLAESAFLAEQFVAATRGFRDFHTQHPYHELQEYSLSYLGLALLEVGEQNAASEALNQSLKRFPFGRRSFDARRVLLRLAAQSERSDVMRTHLDAVRTRLTDGQQSEWHYWNGRRLAIDQQWLESQQEFERSLQGSRDEDIARDAIKYAAEAAYAGGQTESAIERYQELLRRWPHHVESELALLRLAEWAIDAEDYEHVVSLSEEFVQRFPDSYRKRDAARMVGRAYLKQRRFDEAVEALEPLTKNVSGRSVTDMERYVIWYHLATAHQGAGRSKKALEILNRIRAEGASTTFQSRVYFAKAATLESLERFDEAEQVLRLADAHRDANPAFHARILHKRISVLLRNGQIEDALDRLQRWQPNEPNGWFARSAEAIAVTAKQKESYPTAEAAYQAWVAHGGATPSALQGLLSVQLKQQKIAEAGDTLSRLQRLFPDDELTASGTLIYATACQEQGHIEAASTAYRRLFSRPDAPIRYWSVALRAARLFEQQGKPGDSLELLRQASAGVTDDAKRRQIDYQQAWLYRKSGQASKALERFQVLHQAGPQDEIWQDVTYRLAMHAYQSQKFAEAERLTQQLAEAMVGTPTSQIRPYVLYLRAQLSSRAGDWHSALLRLDQLLTGRHNELHLPARLLSSEALYRLGDYDNALYRLESLLDGKAKLDPPRADWVHLRIAQIRGAQGRWPEAIQVAQQVVDAGRQSEWKAEAYLVIGSGLIATGHPIEAIRQLESIVTQQDANKETLAAARWHIGNARFQRGDYDQAIREFAQIDQDAGDWYARASLRLGECLERTDRIGLAVQAYERITFLDESPYREEALQSLRRLASTRLNVRAEQLPVSIEEPLPSVEDSETDAVPDEVEQGVERTQAVEEGSNAASDFGFDD